MSDFSNLLDREGKRGVLSPFGLTPHGDLSMIDELAIAGSGVWTANRAVYAPVCVQQPITVTDAITTVVTQNGNLDVGIYDWAGVRLVSSGSTAVGTALTVQTIALADTALKPGWYYIGFSCNSSTAAFSNSTQAVGSLRVCGYREQLTAFALPDPATFAVYATAVAPLVAVGYRAAL